MCELTVYLNPQGYGFDIALLVLSSPITTITQFTKLPIDPAVSTTRAPTTTRTTTRGACSCTYPTVARKQKDSRAEDLLRAFSTYANAPAVIAGWGETSQG